MTGAYIWMHNGLQGMTEAYRGDRTIHMDVQWLTGDEAYRGDMGFQSHTGDVYRGAKGITWYTGALYWA